MSATVSSTDVFQEAAALNRSELAHAEAAETSVGPESKGAGGAAKFVGGTRVPVYRFFVHSTGVHFYTASEAERQVVQSTLSASHVFEGVAFHVSSTPATGLSPVHRYYNTTGGTHFYTISAEEKAYIDANIPALRYEGIAFYASQTGGNGLLALVRFFQRQAGTHFYTRNAAEAQTLRTTMAAIYQEEGTAFYVIDPDYVALPVPRLPHSGVTTQQCYQAGSAILVACSGAGARALNSQQDGHRTAVNPMSYSEVTNPAGGFFARTECVRDNVTGLMWEGKTASGLRAVDNGYTNYDDPTQQQKWFGGGTYVNPTQAEIDAASNSLGYVNHVNGIALCGYTDWRLPTVDELQSIVDYGVADPGPALAAAWFPNTPGIAEVPGTLHWSSSPKAGRAEGAWGANFNNGYVGDFGDRSFPMTVRLVRGASAASAQATCPSIPTASRFSFNAAGNEVTDSTTGLVWARCSAGQSWSGSACTGTASTHTHEQALVLAQAATGWRLPNVKELSSIVDKGCQGPAIDSMAFPATPSTQYWTSSPYVDNADRAWVVVFIDGYVNGHGNGGRNFTSAVRLVRASR